MTYARSEIVEPDEIGVYHCVVRCVRRSFLCGFDKLSGKSYEHRREWIRARLSFLTEVFGIEVIAYAIMNNHLHFLVRIRPDIASGWDATEVAIRWRRLFPRRRVNGQPAEPNKGEIDQITGNKELVKLYQERLCSISWFNRCLNENIARLSNAEDRCKGRFWEGRFKCQRVFDVNGLLACSAYIDLNPVRAGTAKTPEESDFTSIQERISTRISKKPTIVPLVSIEDITDNQLTTDEYLTLVDSTGKSVVSGKANISQEFAPILARLKIQPESWVTVTKNFRLQFKRVVGPVEAIAETARRAQKHWFHGISAAKLAFG